MPEAAAGAGRSTILFFAEAVTLAHVARPVVLASALDRGAFDVHLAHDPRYRSLLGDLDLTEHAIRSITPLQFTQALAGGKPLYDRATLTSYVEEDLRVIAAVRPDIVVGDFRLSLAVSAELAGVPYVALSNAYWSPYCKQRYVVPELPLTRALGSRLAQGVFALVRPLVFALHCRPMNRVRRDFGLAGLGFDLNEVYTHADHTLYADIPEMYRMENLPGHHDFIGPVVWSPKYALPDWWTRLPPGRPIVYLTLGSSGEAGLLPGLISTLGQMDVTALVSTAGCAPPGQVPDNVFTAPYLPGDEAAALSSLVICNGGSPTTHQALAKGVPVIGLAGNLDQYLNMQAIEKAGAGRLLRAGEIHPGRLRDLVLHMLGTTAYSESARSLSERFARRDCAALFSSKIRDIAHIY